ncbi:MAG: hypothetical protein ACLP01_20830 [Solirubrobacteraceae bacterium]
MRFASRALALTAALTLLITSPVALAATSPNAPAPSKQALTFGVDALSYAPASSPAVESADASAPVNQSQPTITGNPWQGVLLMASAGTWSPTATSYSYQWEQNTGSGYQIIPSATNSYYALSTADIGSELEVLVSAANSAGTTEATSAPVGPVTSGAPAGTATISGVPAQGNTLNAQVNFSGWQPISYAYQWQSTTDGSTWTDISGQTGASYTTQAADEGASVRVVVTATNDDGSGAAVSAAVGPVLSNAPVNTVAPRVSGTPQDSYVLLTTAGTWSGGSGTTYAYQWQTSPDDSTWTANASQTADDYPLLHPDVGTYVRVIVTATNPDGSASATSNVLGPIIPDPPVPITAPSIYGGTAEVSNMLMATTGTWSGPGLQYSYQWQCNSGSGWNDEQYATSSAYMPTLSDVGSQLRVLVTVTNPDATVQVPSAATAAVQDDDVPINDQAPTVTGAATLGVTLQGATGSWSGTDDTYAYQWQRDSGSGYQDIPGARSSTYTLGAADIGATIELVVTATNPGGDASASSQPVGPVASSAPVSGTAPVSLTPPAISGTTARASILTVTAGTWSPTATAYAYQWERDAGSGFVAISGATGPTYMLQQSDEQAKIEVIVTATNAYGSTGATSAAFGPVLGSPPVASTAPTIWGSAVRGQVLTSTEGAWIGAGNTYAHQWQRSTDAGTTWTAIAGATASTYALQVADEGTEVRLLITATNPDATAVAASRPTTIIASAAPVSAHAPAISGTAQQGSLLSIAMTAWTAAPGTVYSYAWERCNVAGQSCQAIAGATGVSYRPTAADVGSTLVAVATATNPDVTVNAASAATAEVLPATSANAASATLAQGKVVLRNAHGVTLATAQLLPAAPSPSPSPLPSPTAAATRAVGFMSAAGSSARHASPVRVLEVQRAGGVRGVLGVWALSLAGARVKAASMPGARVKLVLDSTMAGKLLIAVERVTR